MSKAYAKWLEKHKKKEIRLPGVDFTNKQLFFINFAQVSVLAPYGAVVFQRLPFKR